MKNLLALATIALLSCMTANAEEVSTSAENENLVSENQEVATDNTQESTDLKPVVFSNSYILNLKAPQTSNTQQGMVTNDYKQTQAYKSGKTLRTVGIVTTAVGAAWSGVFGAGAISCSAQDSNGWGSLGTAVLGWYAAFGVPVIGAGITMWAIGQHKMNKVKPASNGVGLAYVF